MYAIETKGLKKCFKSRKETTWALKGVDLKVKKGHAYGLLGPNGAGKTTLIHILSTLIIPTSGSVNVLGFDVIKDPNKVKKRIGIAMGGTAFYWDLTPVEILRYFGRLYGIPSSKRNLKIEELIKKLGITRFRNEEFANLSTGMRQKVAIAKSLLNEPDVLFLDEPTAGLDVEVAIEVRNYIKDLIQERDMTVLLTSHQMNEVESMCKRISIINQGKLITEGEISEIRKNLNIPKIIHLYLDSYEGLDFIKKLPGVIHYGINDGLFITVDNARDRVSRILAELKNRKKTIKDLEVKNPSLEEVFLTIVGKEDLAKRYSEEGLR